MRYRALQQKIWNTIRHSGTDMHMNTMLYTLKWLDDHPEEHPGLTITRAKNEELAKLYLDSNSWSWFRDSMGIEVEQPKLPTETGSVVRSQGQTFVLDKYGAWRSDEWFIGAHDLILNGFTVVVS